MVNYKTNKAISVAQIQQTRNADPNIDVVMFNLKDFFNNPALISNLATICLQQLNPAKRTHTVDNLALKEENFIYLILLRPTSSVIHKNI